MNVTQDLSILSLIWNASKQFTNKGIPPLYIPYIGGVRN